MTLENVYYIGQTIAVVAILGTLIILIVQLRQANKLARNAANREQIASMHAATRLFIDNPDIADLWIRGNKDVLGLTEAERLRYASLRLSLWRLWEALYTQHRDGLVDEDLWEAHLVQARMALNEPGAKAVWAIAKPTFTKNFQAFFDNLLASPINIPSNEAGE